MRKPSFSSFVKLKGKENERDGLTMGHVVLGGDEGSQEQDEVVMGHVVLV